MTTVADVMNTKLVTVEPSASVAHAATVMGGNHVGSALVMDGESLVGIFTERDILRALSQDFDAPSDAVSAWMTARPRTIEPQRDVVEALNLMLDGGFRHFPVLEGDRVVGMVSMRDLSRAASEAASG